MEKKRSKGVTIIGNYHKWFLGVFGICVGSFILAMLIMPSETYLETLKESGRTLSGNRIAAVHFLILSVISFILGKNLLLLKKWTRKVTIYFTFYCLLASVTTNINSALSFELRSVVNIFFSMATSIAIIFYLTRPKVKEQFR